jgi:hypothetical protein
MGIWFGKKLILKVTSEGISTKKKHIKWDDIIGVQEFTEPILHQFFQPCPMFIILLKGGKTLWVPKWVQVEGIKQMNYQNAFENKFENIFSLLDHIKTKAPNINKLSGWFSWRALAPILLLQPPVMIASYMYHYKLDSIDIFSSAHTTVMVTSVVLGLIGLIWEAKARKKLWK